MILQKAKIETAYLKAGLLGFAGSGKTHTAMLIAIGTAKYLKSQKPIAILDTEAGTDFWISRLKKAKIEAVRAKSRAFQDLLSIVQEAEKTSDILIIDSISHIWKNFLEGYMKRLNRTRLQFQDWNVIKPEWGKFTDVFLNSKLHIVMCGRAGWEYDYFENDAGQKELIKTGTKMKAESEMGYEPSLLLEMERVRPEDGEVGQKWIHRCHVLKDRSDTIDGKMFDNPTFDCFLPHFQELNIGGEHLVIDTTRTSEEVFDKEGLTEDARIEKRRKILLEEVEGVLIRQYPATTGKDKQAKLEMIQNIFETTSWTKISILPIEILQGKLEVLKRKLDEQKAKPLPKDGMIITPFLDKPIAKDSIPPTPAELLISLEQLKRFHTICSERKIPTETVKRYLKNNYDIDSSKDIQRAWYDDVISWTQNWLDLREPGVEG